MNKLYAIENYTAHGGPVKGLTLSPNGEYMVSSSFDYSSVIWDTKNLKEKFILNKHDAAVNVAKFSRDGRKLATGSDDNKILLWDIEELINNNKTNPIILSGHKGKVVDIDFNKDGKKIISASWDGSIGIWDLERSKIKSRFIYGHDGPVNNVQFSMNENEIYSAGYDGEVRVWDLKEDLYLRTLIKNGWGINVMKIDEAQDIIAYGTTDGVMVLERLSNGKKLIKMGTERTPVLSIHQSLNGNQIAFGNAKGQVKIIDVNTNTLLRDFKAANGPIWSLLIMPKIGDLIVASLNDYVSLWRMHEFPPHILNSEKNSHRFQPSESAPNGEKQFARKCSVCHTLTATSKKRAGPSLFNLFGREAGTYEGYNYSKALLDSKIIWDEESIHRLFTEGPDVVTPGTKMPIQKMKNEKDRQDLIAYLKNVTNPNNNIKE